MRVIAKSVGLLLAAALAACAQSAGLPPIGLLGTGDQAKPETTASAEEADLPGGGPPMPARNERLRKTAVASAGANPGEKSSGGLSLTSLADVKLFTPTSYAPDSVRWDDAPVQVYSQLAQQIRACWFKPSAPKLTNYGFFATVADGNADQATIIIYQKDETGGRGVQAFRILITGDASSSTVKAENRHLDAKLDQSFKTDIARWAKGGKDC
jgi:hypothetical protein